MARLREQRERAAEAKRAREEAAAAARAAAAAGPLNIFLFARCFVSSSVCSCRWQVRLAQYVLPARFNVLSHTFCASLDLLLLVLTARPLLRLSQVHCSAWLCVPVAAGPLLPAACFSLLLGSLCSVHHKPHNHMRTSLTRAWRRWWGSS